MRVPAGYLRPAVQTACFAGILFLFVGLQYPVRMRVSNLLLVADPLAAAATLIYGIWTYIPWLLPVAGFVAGTLLLGRAFCGWVCPVGFLSDLAARLRRGKNRDRFGWLQYGVLAATLISFTFTPAVLAVLDPLVVFQRSAYLVWTGAGIPVVLLLIVAAALVVPRFWCRAICPLGGLLGVLSLASPFPRKLGESCNRCGKCHRACQMGAISKDLRWDATACTRCLDCEGACPTQAIGFGLATPQPPRISPSRRAFVAGAISLGLLAASKGAASALTPPKSLVRPPGSLVEEKFNAACLRCESCVKACPSGVIVPAGLDSGLDRLATPHLDFERAGCQLCGTCGQICPTGAIINLPEDEIKIGTAYLDEKQCIAWVDNKTCLLCQEVCPVGAITSRGRLRPVVHPDACIGCGNCQYHCPLEEKAIIVLPDGERRRDR